MGMLLLISFILLVLAIIVKPIRKGMGLLFIILGIIECLSSAGLLVGLLVGIPSILIGGILLFA